MLVLKVSPVRALRAYGATVRQLGFAILTVMAVLALAYVMNASGETTTLGKWMAGAGDLFALLSPILGWFGVAVTGSDTSCNSLFGALQVAAAKGAHLDPILMAAGNSSGGAIGKMISPQNLAIGAAAVGWAAGRASCSAGCCPGAASFCSAPACWSTCGAQACCPGWSSPTRKGAALEAGRREEQPGNEREGEGDRDPQRATGRVSEYTETSPNRAPAARQARLRAIRPFALAASDVVLVIATPSWVYTSLSTG